MAILILGAPIVDIYAQEVDTVRENEFRSRWANYQVDRPASASTTQPDAEGEGESAVEGVLAALGRSFDELFGNGPFQMRADLATGWEFSDEDNLRQVDPKGSDNSFFTAPSIGLFYNQERGPVTVSARYSAGYVYYLDQNYLAANHDGGILSQTAGLDLTVEGERTTFTSQTAASYGNGNDIESGLQRDLLDASESVAGSFLISNFNQIGSTASLDYQRYSGGGVAATETTTSQVTVYLRHVISPKTWIKCELDAGEQLQSTGTNLPESDRYFAQGLISTEYFPTAKLTLDVGVGYGFQSDSDVVGRGQSGSHPVYQITVAYTPTEKTTASLRFGYEGVDVEPDLQLAVHWQFRPTTSASLSVYQSSGFSTYEIGQNLVTRGSLLSIRQRFFGRLDLTLEGGVEQSTGYAGTVAQQTSSESPYYFGDVSFLFQINSYLAVQGYYRAYTGEAGSIINNGGLQSRAAISLRLTF